MKNKIFILSEPIQSGKTSVLLEFWKHEKLNCDGFLTPDIDNMRKIIFLDTGEIFPLSLEQEEDDMIVVGKFRFSNSTFQKAKNKLSLLDQTKAKYLILDEIGKLELHGSGFEPELNVFIKKFKDNIQNKILILVVRNTLLKEVMTKYKLENASLLSLDSFRNKFMFE